MVAGVLEGRGVNPSLWFVVPVHGRIALAAKCLEQLGETCTSLRIAGVDATAVVIADAENHSALELELRRDLGFARVVRDNRFLGRRFNDGIQLALDPAYNGRPADYVVPCGSDDWVDWRLFVDLPKPNTIVGFRAISFVRADGAELLTTELTNTGGSGIRIYPRELLEPLGFRPAEEDRRRACDTSILTRTLRARPGARIEHRASDPRQIVDWKSPHEQLNSYEAIFRRHRGERFPDPFAELAEFFPALALRRMRALFGDRLAVV